ncbi:transposase, partial [Desulfocicer niacini]
MELTVKYSIVWMSIVPQKDLCFVIDDTILQKSGRKIENASYIHDHTVGRSVLGFCIVTLGLFTGNAFYP